jgi:TRAP-type transport system periplasmic protein
MLKADRAGVVAVAALTLMLFAACRSESNKAGGQSGRKSVVLTLANGNGEQSELKPFIDEVARLSGGAIRIELRSNWRRGQVAYENGLIRDVNAGKADLGWAGSRAWDSLGVNSFRALHAPLLVDSYALEGQVVRTPVVTEMLRSLRQIGLVGLGVLPGPMRKPLGVRRPLLEPADYLGLKFGVQQSRVADATMRALGAEPVSFPAGSDISRFDGVEQQIAAIEGNRYYAVAKFLTSNVNLWPRPLVLFANRRAFHRLTPGEQSVLRRAATNVVPGQIALDRRMDRDASDVICRGGFMTFATVTPADLASLRRAVQPVYDRLERDPGTRGAIRAIERLKRALRIAPDPLSACGRNHKQAFGQATPIDGVWRMTTKFGDAPDDPDPTPVAENYGTWTFVFDRGRFAITQQYKNACTWGYGRFRVNGQQTLWTFSDGGGIAPNQAYNKPGEFFRFGWSRYRDTLKLTPVKGAISPENFRVKPWHLISSTPSRRFLNGHCPPPARALTR